MISPIQWYGGKGNMQGKLQPFIETARQSGATVYCEPYCGGASTLFGLRAPFPVEVVNDLDDRIVNLFRVLQNPVTFAALRHRILYTPYARGEFVRALAEMDSDDPLRRAWGFFVAQGQGFGGQAKTAGDWGRNFTLKSPAPHKWQTRLSLLDAWHARLMRVQIDHRDALEFVQYWDMPQTLFYVDPPYISETRAPGSRSIYRHETDNTHHAALVDTLLSVQGQVILSGYDSPLYAPLEAAGWHRSEYQTAAHAAGKVRASSLRGKGAVLAAVPRVEVIWSKISERRTLFDYGGVEPPGGDMV